jgi:DNA relaxase NicK
MREPLRIETGVDWITSTARIGTEQAERIMHYGAENTHNRSKQGTYPQATRLLGFDGFSSGKTAFYGQSSTHAMLRITGEEANGAFKAVNRANDHYSRLDIQVTVWLPELPKTYNERMYGRLLQAFNPDTGKGSGPRRYTDGKGGWTIYSTDRTAKQMARIYNKYAETPEPQYKGAIRYELELKDIYACEMAGMLDLQGIHAERYLLSYLKLWYKRKGIILPYNSRTADISLLSVPHAQSDVERQLQWLERQVKPTVRRLIELGLQEYVTMLLFGSSDAGITGSLPVTPEE